MKRKKVFLVIVAIILVSILIDFIFINHRRNVWLNSSPLEYAEKQSELNLPQDIGQCVEFNQDWRNANGDGSRMIEFDLTQEQVFTLEKQCLNKPYNSLPIKENGYNPSSLSPLDKGYYKLKLISKKHRWDYELTVLDVSNRKLFLFVEIVGGGGSF